MPDMSPRGHDHNYSAMLSSDPDDYDANNCYHGQFQTLHFRRARSRCCRGSAGETMSELAKNLPPIEVLFNPHSREYRRIPFRSAWRF